MAVPDDPQLIPLSAAAFHHYRPRLAATDAVIAISASREFREVVSTAAELRGVVPVVGIVQAADSSLGRVASEVVVAAGGPSAMPVTTRTFLSTATAGALVAAGLLGDRVAAEDARSQVRAAADHCQAANGAAAEVVEGIAPLIARFDHGFVVGGGAAAIAAGEAALKLTEMALVHTEGVETWEAESGAATLLGPGTFVVALRPTGPASEATAALVANAVAWGATVVEVAPAPTAPAVHLVRLPPDAPEAVAPLFTVPPVARLAYHVARARGVDADRPGWVARYAAQGLHHVAGA
jgi:glucosamine--fructose-6-phosphate aminotransferase (isomerizing)